MVYQEDQGDLVREVSLVGLGLEANLVDLVVPAQWEQQASIFICILIKLIVRSM